MNPLEERIGHRFADASLLKQALTHPSLAKGYNNQRLEFLGDAALGAAVARLLYEAYPKENEGELARRQAALVCGPTLARVAEALGLGEAMHMAASEAAGGGRANPTNLEDACEALIGALFLDGGYEAAERFVRAQWASLAKTLAAPPKDAKTALQEWSQGRGLPVPAYRVTESSGPAHAPVFTVEVSLPGYAPVFATASTKRAAEQAAAGEMLKALGA